MPAGAACASAGAACRSISPASRGRKSSCANTRRRLEPSRGSGRRPAPPGARCPDRSRRVRRATTTHRNFAASRRAHERPPQHPRTLPRRARPPNVKDLQRVHVRRHHRRKAGHAGGRQQPAQGVARRAQLRGLGGMIAAIPRSGSDAPEPGRRQPHLDRDGDCAIRGTASGGGGGGLALELLLDAGQRRGDGRRWASSTSRAAASPCASRRPAGPCGPDGSSARPVLAAAPKTNMTFMQNRARGCRSRPRALPIGSGALCVAAGLPKACSPHGLRKAACRRLAEAGCSANEIAAISGHASLKEVTRYTAAADREHLADQAIARQLRATPRTNLPNNPTHVYPTAKKR